VFDSILNAERRFIYSAISSLWVPATQIFGVLYLADICGITGIALAVLIGFLLQLVMVLPIMPRYFKGYSLLVDFSNPALWEAVKLLGFAVAIVIIGHISTAVDRLFGSLLGEGAVSSLSLGFVLIGIIPILVVFPIFKVLYPELTRFVQEKRRDCLNRLLSWNFLFIIFITLPITVGIYMFSLPITKIVFWGDRITDQDILNTAKVIEMFSLSLPTSAMILPIFYFFALKRVKFLVNMLFLTILIHAALDYLLMSLIGLEGIALSSSLVAYMRLVILVVSLKKTNKDLKLKGLAGPFLKVGVATVSMILMVRLLLGVLTDYIEADRFFNQIVINTLIILAGMLTYVVINILLKNRSILDIFQIGKKGENKQ
jgi:putative peptidoglycan lipid II flippase